MELAEPFKSEETAARDTSRTIKPADRCVISYNFEQNNSQNITHNLLIGMFNEKNTSLQRKKAQHSQENNKPKPFSLVPQHKKIARQDPHTIVKVYDSSLYLKKYVNPNSPVREFSSNKHSQLLT